MEAGGWPIGPPSHRPRKAGRKLAPRARVTPAPPTAHASRRRRRPASYAILLALGLALAAACVVVPRSRAVAHVPQKPDHPSGAEAGGHGATSEAAEYGARKDEPGEYAAGEKEAGEYGHGGPAAGYGGGSTSGGGDDG